MGQGRVCTFETKALSFTHRTKVIADGTEAVKDKLADTRKHYDKPWMAAFGRLRHLGKESAKINRLIEEEFEQVEAEDRL